ncbi:MAG: hypothetical protein ACOYXB_09380 [Bacteroidota bacterium]
MKRIITLVFSIVIFQAGLYSQSVGINDDGSAPNSAAMLDVKSSTRGLLPPRMTEANKNSMTLVAGMIIYQTDGSSGYYYCDGTNWKKMALWQVDGTAIQFPAGANNTTIESDGTMIFEGSATVFDDVLVPFTQAKQGSTSKPDFDYTNVGLLFPQNDPSEIIYVVVQIPHSYLEGSSITPHIHWQQSSSSFPTWKMDYKWFNNDDAIPATFTTLTTNTGVHTYTSGNMAQISSFGSVTGAANALGGGLSPNSKKISSLMLIKIYRDDNTVTGDVLGFQFDVHYEKSTAGSHTEYTK